MENILFENKWISVIERDGYTMYRLPWCKGGQGVAVLPFRRKVVGVTKYNEPVIAWEYLGRFERFAAHNEPVAKLTAITGGMDKEGESARETAIRELEEEAGIIARPEDLINLGFAYDSKSSDHQTQYFAIDLDKVEYAIVPIVGDGTKYEEGAYAKWVSEQECMFATELRLAGMIGRLKTLYKG